VGDEVPEPGLHYQPLAMDRAEKKLIRKADRAAAKLRRALNGNKSAAECNRLGEALAAAQRELARYQNKR
jgi:hypothetical protein